MPIPREEIEIMAAEEEKMRNEAEAQILAFLKSQPEMMFTEEEIVTKIGEVGESLI